MDISAILRKVARLEKRLEKTNDKRWKFIFRVTYNQNQMDSRLHNLSFYADRMTHARSQPEYRKALSRWASLIGYYDLHEERRDRAQKRSHELLQEEKSLEKILFDLKKRLPVDLNSFFYPCSESKDDNIDFNDTNALLLYLRYLRNEFSLLSEILSHEKEELNKMSSDLNSKTSKWFFDREDCLTQKKTVLVQKTLFNW